VRAQRVALEEGWKKPDAARVPDSVKQSAGALRERLDALMRKLQLSMRFEADDPPSLEYRPPSVTQRLLLRLSGGLDGYAAKPTTTQLEELAALTGQVADLEAAWKKVADEDVPAFNRAVASAGISTLTASR
jgi:AcrR family transcriptional regulator